MTWDDVMVPAQLPEVVDRISYERVVMNAGTTWDYVPWHYNPEYAQSHGHPTIFVNTMHLAGFVDRIATDFGGPYSRVVRRRCHCSARSMQAIRWWRVAGWSASASIPPVIRRDTWWTSRSRSSTSATNCAVPQRSRSNCRLPNVR